MGALQEPNWSSMDQFISFTSKPKERNGSVASDIRYEMNSIATYKHAEIIVLNTKMTISWFLSSMDMMIVRYLLKASHLRSELVASGCVLLKTVSSILG
jgi:hypothetical protein